MSSDTLVEVISLQYKTMCENHIKQVTNLSSHIAYLQSEIFDPHVTSTLNMKVKSSVETLVITCKISVLSEVDGMIKFLSD
jgi:hypothetical protein